MSQVRCTRCGDFLESKEAYYAGNDDGWDVYYCFECARERGVFDDAEYGPGPTEEQLAHEWDDAEEG